MAEQSGSLHEDPALLSQETIDMHRAIVSLMEELEAVDWYSQRIDATGDEALASILGHNRDEEVEHACMTLEWIRRRSPKFDEFLRRYLFTEAPVVEIEEEAEDGAGSARKPSLGIGSLRAAGADGGGNG